MNISKKELYNNLLSLVSTGESQYTEEQLMEIRAIYKQEIPLGKDYLQIYKETIKQIYPLTVGPGMVKSEQQLRSIYNEEAKLFKESVKIDKEIVLEQILAQQRELYWKYKESDPKMAIKILDSMLKTVGADKAQRILEQMDDKDGNVTFHLDFGL